MWPSNRLTERLKLKFPIIQAPMGIITTPAMAAAVSNAGGLGGLGMWGLSAEDAARRIAGFRQQSAGNLNVNYPLWPDPACAAEISEAMRRHLQSLYDAKGLGPVPEPEGVASEVSPEHVAMLLEMKPEVVSFHFGLPEPGVVEAIKSAGIFILSSATTVAEARILERRGVNAVIAQGTRGRRTPRDILRGRHRHTAGAVRAAAAGGRRGEGAGHRRRRDRRRPHRGGGLCARRQRRAAGHRLYALRGSEHV
jgi:nitronate monooxygenase